MNGASDGIFNTMVKDAIAEVSSAGWKQASDKAVTLASFGLLAERIDKKISRIIWPAWVIALSLASSVIWSILS